MGRRIRSDKSVLPNGKRSAQPVSTDAKDAMLARLELERTHSQLQIEHLQRLLAEEQGNSRRLEAIYQHSPVGYVTIDDKGLITEWNRSAADFLDITKHALLGAPLSFFAVREDMELALMHFRRCKRATGGRVISELRFKRRNEQVPVQILSVPFRQGNKTFYQTALIDLTERKKNERALEETKKFLETIIQTIHEPLLVVDVNLRILQSNEAFT